MPRDHLDRYYTPDVVARTLVNLLPIVPGDLALEPSVGAGAFARALRGRGARVAGIDLDPDAAGFKDCDAGHTVGDFLECPASPSPRWVVGNPPFAVPRPHKKCEGKGCGDCKGTGSKGSDEVATLHVAEALDVTTQHAAFLLRLAILESKDRIPFWRSYRPHLRKVWVLAERPSFTDGGTDNAAYALFWFDKLYTGPSEVDVISWRCL